MFVPSAAEIGLFIDSIADGTQPVAANGTSVVPGINTYSAYASVLSGASVVDDAFGIWINVNTVAISGSARDALVTIGLDPAGGASFTDFINDLIVSCAGSYTGSVFGTGIWYWFNVRIPAGASIGAKSTVNGAVAGNCRVRVVLACRPKNPEMMKVGTYVVTYGSTPATSTGTAITAGTASEGAWTQIGTVGANDRPFYWQVGVGCNNSTMTGSLHHLDVGIGDGTNKRIVIANQNVWTTTSETLTATYPGAASQAQPGDGIYARLQQSTAASGLSVVAYGVC